MNLDARGKTVIGLLTIIAFCLVALFYGLFFRFLVTQEAMDQRVRIQLANVTEQCEIKAETAKALERTTDVLGQLPRCIDLLNTMNGIRKGNEQTQTFIERLEPLQKEELVRWGELKPSELSHAILSEQGVQRSLAQLVDPGGDFQRTMSAIDGRTRALAECDSASLGPNAAICVENNLKGAGMFMAISKAQAGVDRQLALRSNDGGEPTLGSTTLDTNNLLRDQQDGFARSLNTAVADATRAVRDPDRAVIEWIGNHAWRPAPKFKPTSANADDDEPRRALRVLVPAAQPGAAGSVCRNIMVLAHIRAKGGAENLLALNNLCGDRDGMDSNFSCIATGKKSEDQRVTFQVHGIVATVGPLEPVEGKAECQGEILLDESAIDMLDLGQQNVEVLLGIDPQGVRRSTSLPSPASGTG